MRRGILWSFVLLVVGLGAAHAAPGKLYLVGAGTAPDLITVRGLNVVKQADIILLEEPGEKKFWADLIGDKEVWFCPHRARIMFGLDPNTLPDEKAKVQAREYAKMRQDAVDKIKAAVEAGKTIVALEGGDAMMYGTTWYLELLPPGFPAEVVPGVGAFEASVAAVKYSPSFGWDTNSVILTMSDWPGRSDTNEKLMATQTSMIFYTMHLDYPQLFAQLKKHYPANTPVAVVSFAGDPEKQQVIASTVGSFLKDVQYDSLPADMHMLLVGKFLRCGQARKDALMGAVGWETLVHPNAGNTPPPK